MILVDVGNFLLFFMSSEKCPLLIVLGSLRAKPSSGHQHYHRHFNLSLSPLRITIFE